LNATVRFELGFGTSYLYVATRQSTIRIVDWVFIGCLASRPNYGEGTLPMSRWSMYSSVPVSSALVSWSLSAASGSVANVH